MQKVLNPIVLGKMDDDLGWEGIRFSPVHFLARPLKFFKPIEVMVLEHSMSQQLFRPLFWLLCERPDGLLQIQTTVGMVLATDCNGNLRLQVKEVMNPEDDSFFIMDRYDSTVQSSSSDHVENPSEVMECVINGMNSEPSMNTETSVWDDLWTIRSVNHNWFLSTSCFDHLHRSTAKQETSLCFSKVPMFWTVQGRANGGGMTYTCTKEMPFKRFHDRQYWSIQSLQYVTCMKTRLLEEQSTNPRLSIHEALALARDIPLKPFRKRKVHSNVKISVRTMCFAMAEAARTEDFPDWIQVVALIHELGRVSSLFDDEINRGQAFDWTISCGARVVGCQPPSICSFSAFRHLDPDNERYGDMYYSRHCGFADTLLTWSGPEYLYHLFRMNNTLLCDEALSVLRLFSLRCWHAYNGVYAEIENEEDIILKSTVNEFDRLRRRVKRMLYDKEDIMESLYSDAMCEALWQGYYSTLLAKYNCNGAMQW